MGLGIHDSNHFYKYVIPTGLTKYVVLITFWEMKIIFSSVGA